MIYILIRPNDWTCTTYSSFVPFMWKPFDHRLYCSESWEDFYFVDFLIALIESRCCTIYHFCDKTV